MPGLAPHPHRKWIYTAPHLTANIKQEMCAEFDDALVRLIEAAATFHQASFQLEYLRDNIDELRADDPDRHNLAIKGSHALAERIELGADGMCTQMLELHETLMGLRHELVEGTIKLSSPDAEDVSDNDEPPAVPSRFVSQYPTGGDDCSS